MILAGDIGGTKTRLGLFERRRDRPVARRVESYPTTEYAGLPAMLDAFLASESSRPALTAATFGVAGPVINQSAQMTNVEWCVSADEVAASLGIDSVRLLNDLEAMAYAVPVLAGEELLTLQPGRRREEGNIAVIAAGTGLGGAVLHRLRGTYTPVASEIGHTDFAARTDRELAFVRLIRDRYGRVEIEHVLCGPGLLNLAEFTHQHSPCREWNVHDSGIELPAEVSAAALENRCACCVEALQMFVEAYGAVAGNLALTAVTTGGVFIGGGIAPRIVEALQSGRFMTAFLAKGPMRPLLEDMPVHVILNDQAGLLGAAVYANGQVGGQGA